MNLAGLMVCPVLNADDTPLIEAKKDSSPSAGEWHSIVAKRIMERVRPDGSKEVLEVSGKQEDWPYRPFTYVKAYVFDREQGSIKTYGPDVLAPSGQPAKQVVVSQSYLNSIFPNNSYELHPGVIYPKGAELTTPQIQALLTAITGVHDHNPKDCCEPHHAFVFYDAKDEAVGWITLCFSCECCSSGPPGLTNEIDYKALLKIMEDLRVPVSGDPDFYTKLFEKTHPKSPPKAEEKSK